MKQLSVVVLCLFFALGNFSCNKKSKTLTKTEKLCSKKWLITKCTVDPALTYDMINFYTDYYTYFMSSCFRDDYLQFTEDHQVIMYQNATKCKPTYTNAYIDGTWQWDSTESKLIIQYYYYLNFPSNYIINGKRTWDIIQMTDEVLQYKRNLDTIDYGFDYTYTAVPK